MAETKRLGVFRHLPQSRRHCVRSWESTSTCSRTRPQQRNHPIRGRRSLQRRLSLAEIERPRDVTPLGLYTFARPSWSSVLIFILLCQACHVHCEQSAPTTSTTSETLDDNIGTCEGETDCRARVDSIMGHTHNTQSAQIHQLSTMLANTQRLWVFGYGSLVWKTGFSYNTKKIGYLKGYVRRFWQGDSTHRGTASAPGRTATLEEDKSGKVWGVAFELVGRHQIETALDHLGLRECDIGGYSMKLVDFYPSDNEGIPNNNEGIPNNNEGIPNINEGIPNINEGIPNNNEGIPNNNEGISNNNEGISNNNEGISTKQGNPLQTLLFIATPENTNYLGKASIRDLGDQILNSRGHAGHNVEYVTRLADFLRDQVPGYHGDQVDSHLEELDSYLRRSLQQVGVDLQGMLEEARKEDYSYMYSQGVHSEGVHQKGVHQEGVHDEDGCQEGRGL